MCRKLLIGTRRSICVGLLLGLHQKCFVERKLELGQIYGKQASSKEVGPMSCICILHILHLHNELQQHACTLFDDLYLHFALGYAAMSVDWVRGLFIIMLLPLPQSVGGGLLQSFGDFCPSTCPNPPVLNGKGRLRESTYSMCTQHKGIAIMLSPAQWCYSSSVQLCLQGTNLSYMTDCHSVLWLVSCQCSDSVNRQWLSLTSA